MMDFFKTLIPFKEFFPFVVVIIATSGGLLSGYILQRVTRTSEKRKFFREKLEEIYLLCDVISQNNANNLKALTFLLDKKKEGVGEPLTQKPIRRLSMLVNIYFSSLNILTDNLVKANNEFTIRSILWCKDVMATGKLPAENVKESLNQSYFEVERRCDALKEAIKCEIEKHF